MKKIILFILLSSSLFATDYTKYWDFLLPHEGYRNQPYLLNGLWHVGVGHRLLPDEKLSRYTDDEILSIFIKDIESAIDITRRQFPSFDNQPNEIQLILVSLSYNMGRGGISKFVRFRAAIENRDYKSATAELKNSLWYNQVGGRAKDYIEIVEKCSCKG